MITKYRTGFRNKRNVRNLDLDYISDGISINERQKNHYPQPEQHKDDLFFKIAQVGTTLTQGNTINLSQTK